MQDEARVADVQVAAERGGSPAGPTLAFEELVGHKLLACSTGLPHGTSPTSTFSLNSLHKKELIVREGAVGRDGGCHARDPGMGGLVQTGEGCAPPAVMSVRGIR